MPELLYFEICFMVQKETVLTAFLAIRCCMLIALKDYAAMHGRAHNSARRMAERGSFDTAVKIAGVWLIDSEEPYPDPRRVEPRWGLFIF